VAEVAILYGAPAAGLAEIPADAIQVSPLIPGSQDLAQMAEASADRAVVLAPGGALERDYVVAQALRVLKPGGRLVAFAPKDKGGSRLKKSLEGFGCAVVEDARRHHRFCQAARPAKLTGLGEAIAAGAPRVVPGLGVWSQPGVFSWDRLDPGSAKLIELLPPLKGRGVDLGCGVGLLSQRVLASPAVASLDAVDIDRRAVACAERNLDDPRVRLTWFDARSLETSILLDFVVMNPPFHDGGREDRDLGVAFIATASRLLRTGGVCWLVANRHLPYEAPLSKAFSRFDVRHDGGGYKVIEARR
jgi:16S rRNA (guanine1207-N2)-methyltransferase